MAVDLPDQSSPVFCDPTLAGVSFGGLSFADSDRDVLLVSESGEYQWHETPAFEPIAIEVEADLEMEPTGLYSGWLTIKMNGPEAEMVARHFRSKTRLDRCRTAIPYFLSFLPGVQVVDCSDLTENSRHQESPAFYYKFYVVQSRDRINDESKTVGMALPVNSFFVTRVGRQDSHRKRRYPYISAAVNAQLQFKLSYPEEWQVIDQPPKWLRDEDGYKLQVEPIDSRESNEVAYKVTMNRNKSRFGPVEFEELAQNSRSYAQIVSSSILFKRPVDSQDLDWEPAPSDLPKMPSGEGFMVLVNTRFPLNSSNLMAADHASRIEAFRRVKKMYPNDANTLFLAQTFVYSSRLMQYPPSKQRKRIINGLKKLNRNRPKEISSEKVAVAHYKTIRS